MRSYSPFEGRVQMARRQLVRTPFFGLFVTISSLLALAEAILVSFTSSGLAYTLQIFILIMSTAFFGLGLFMVASVMRSTHFNRLDSIWPKIRAALDNENIFEMVCLIIGWLFIGQSPGYASLRCVRLFRYLWYFNLFEKEPNMNDKPENIPISLSKLTKLGLQYIEKLTYEVGSDKSKGGLILLGLYFYTTYVLAVVIYNVNRAYDTTDDKLSEYQSVTDCFVLMLRLSLFDDTGFNYMAFLTEIGETWVVFLLYGYIVISSFILLRSVLGIFMVTPLSKVSKVKKIPKSLDPDEMGLLDDGDEEEESDEKLYRHIHIELELLRREIQSLDKFLIAPYIGSSGISMVERKLSGLKKHST